MRTKTQLLALLLLVLAGCVYSLRSELKRFWFPDEPRIVLIFIRSETELEVLNLDQSIRTDVLEKRFDKLDRYFSEHQDDYFANGVMKRTSGYFWVFRTENTLADLSTIIARADEWITKNPASLTPRLIKVRALLEIFNGYRSGRWVVDEERSDWRQEYLTRMIEALEEAERVGIDSSRLGPSRVKVATLQGDFVAAIQAFEQARRTDRYSVELFDSIVRGADTIGPRDGVPEWYTLLDNLTTLDDPRECYVYMRIVNGFRAYFREIPPEWERVINWAKYYRGLDYTYATFPEVSQWKNYDALFSSFLGNYDRARPILEEIGAFANMEAWRHYEILIDARRKCGLPGGVIPN